MWLARCVLLHSCHRLLSFNGTRTDDSIQTDLASIMCLFGHKSHAGLVRFFPAVAQLEREFKGATKPPKVPQFAIRSRQPRSYSSFQQAVSRSLNRNVSLLPLSTLTSSRPIFSMSGDAGPRSERGEASKKLWDGKCCAVELVA